MSSEASTGENPEIIAKLLIKNVFSEKRIGDAP